MLLFRLLPTPKSALGFMGYLIVVLYPLSLLLAALGNIDLIAKNIDWIKWALSQWWGYPLCATWVLAASLRWLSAAIQTATA
jgi:hypothetical protein